MAKMGRKTLQEEALKMDVINSCWLTLSRMMNSPKVTEEAKQRVALEICKKSVPQEVNVKGDFKFQLVERIQKARTSVVNRIEPVHAN